MNDSLSFAPGKTAVALCCLGFLSTGATASLLVQFDASALALNDGDTVSSWGGQTAGGTPTYRIAQTPNGKPAVAFDGAADHMGSNIILHPSSAQDWIVAAVIRPNIICAYHNLVDDDAQNRPMLWIDPSFDYELSFRGGTGAKRAGTGPEGWDIVIADSRNNELYVNSPTPNATGRAPVAFSASEAFDFFHRDFGQTYSGLVAELRVYNDAADFVDFESLYEELRTKWLVGPTDLIVELVGDVIALNLAKGIGNSLDAKLSTALESLQDANDNNDGAAVQRLQSFINSVEAQRGGHLSDAEADTLIVAAQTIIDLIQ